MESLWEILKYDPNKIENKKTDFAQFLKCLCKLQTLDTHILVYIYIYKSFRCSLDIKIQSVD